ncbi:Mis12-Mtw1 family protein [Aspergillus eucalypticola CBS 122712]|uniref:Mis12-Mtw1 family protein n=1 Tax=Aspergillus eucalypticola (strain CBS 122712 / IBT 29274) TaxID=1448314 RepID=A0A317VLU3_ASPEC|nr:Mis12-Mtw1 family protein [Aspergillus eucalypticola CBS 122712]PWY74815.1 Mis12-Mtw1 family protein [Aspergillus eucalypticola CBS 122712]
MTVTVLTTSTTKTKRREPLLALDMATSQAQARPAAPGRSSGRRTSARLSLNKQDRGEEKLSAAEKKRKAVFEEDIEGFQFSRITTKKAKPSEPKKVPSPVSEEPAQPSPRRGRPPKKRVEEKKTEVAEEPKKQAEGTGKRRTRGAAKNSVAPVEPAPEPEPQPQPQQQRATRSTRKHDQVETVPLEKKRRKGRPSNSKTDALQQEQSQPQPQPRNGFVSPEPQQSGNATTIALPLADTPVIQRNKEMRGKKSVKIGNRRSSLGMRGRRASSLIDSGASNALPHKKVDTADFYKHIAADLPEPRRMRQLLIWCGTRAMGDKPSGSRSEDESARLAARVIQEELLKEFSSNSELSNWFGREDATPPTLVVKKENPKNIQNAEKIQELEEQIQRLQKERHALNALLRPADIPRIKPAPPEQPESDSVPSSQPSPPEQIDLSLLEPSQREIFAQINPEAAKQQQEPDTQPMETEPAAPEPNLLPQMSPSTVSTRLFRITHSLAPTLDSLAAGIHDIDLYRTMSDTVSTRILRICAERLDERDARRRLATAETSADETNNRQDLSLRPRPREDLGVILGALSRVERRST